MAGRAFRAGASERRDRRRDGWAICACAYSVCSRSAVRLDIGVVPVTLGSGCFFENLT